MVFIPMILLSGSIPVLVHELEAGSKERFRSVTLWIRGLMLGLSGRSFESMYHEPLRTRVPRGLDDAGIAAGGCATACAGQDGICRAVNRAWWVLGFNWAGCERPRGRSMAYSNSWSDGTGNCVPGGIRP